MQAAEDPLTNSPQTCLQLVRKTKESYAQVDQVDAMVKLILPTLLKNELSTHGSHHLQL